MIDNRSSPREIINFWLDMIYNNSYIIHNGKKFWPVKIFVDTRQHFFVRFRSGKNTMKLTYMNEKGIWKNNKDSFFDEIYKMI